MIPGEAEESSKLGFIHRFVPARGSQLTLLLLHGTGGDENNLLPLGSSLLPGAALLSPRGNVLENGMPRFFRRLAEGVFDQDDLKQQTHDLARFVTGASKTYSFDVTKVVAVGYSNGANIAIGVLLLHPHLLAGAVLLRPMGIPLEMEDIPDLSGTKVLIESGTNDPLIPREQTEKLAALLERRNADVSLQWHLAGHSLENEELQVASGWLTSSFGNDLGWGFGR